MTDHESGLQAPECFGTHHMGHNCKPCAEYREAIVAAPIPEPGLPVSSRHALMVTWCPRHIPFHLTESKETP